VAGLVWRFERKRVAVAATLAQYWECLHTLHGDRIEQQTGQLAVLA
jgi:hypothetical protein